MSYVIEALSIGNIVDDYYPVSVPVVVTGELVTVNSAGSDNPTELTKVVELIVISFPEPVTVTFVPGLIFLDYIKSAVTLNI